MPLLKLGGGMNKTKILIISFRSAFFIVGYVKNTMFVEID